MNKLFIISIVFLCVVNIKAQERELMLFSQNAGIDHNGNQLIDMNDEAIFEDDFEGSPCLNKWTIGGRQQEGTNTANCVLRNNSMKGHLYKSSFTEITLSPTYGPFVFSNNLTFNFDMEVRVYSESGAPINYYGKAGVDFSFKDYGGNTLGKVSYIAATTTYPFDNAAADPTYAAIQVSSNVGTSYSISAGEMLSYINVDKSEIAKVQMTFYVYSSTRPFPYVEGELWIDNIIVEELDNTPPVTTHEIDPTERNNIKVSFTSIKVAIMNNKSYPFWRVSSHTFLLGAGASRAAFPNGDKYSRKLPLMNDFIEIVGLENLLDNNEIDFTNQNIEEIYSNLYTKNPKSNLIGELNDKIIDYFSILKIPDEVTLYDELLLSLQKKDAIFSFNWDPLLLQAFSRNAMIGELPSIHFLHGNVLVGICEKDKRVGYLTNRCSVCNKRFSPSKILFPIKNKNYNKDSFIESEWELLSYYLDNSFIFSIFGYSAPTTDIEAKDIMHSAWNKNKHKQLNEIDIIDIRPRKKVEENWAGFIYHGHVGIFDNIKYTQSFKYARRSCESWGDAILQCDPWSENNLPKFKNLKDLQSWIKPLIEEEIDFRNKDITIQKYKKST